jgi:SPX domain protein involved in polyphosphate accumulation
MTVSLDSIGAETPRLETKFIASQLSADRIETWLNLHAANFSNAYPARWVNSVYFDTYDYFAYRENIYGASHRSKLRYRWYGADKTPQAGHLELKVKRNVYGRKHREKIDTLNLPQDFTWNDFRAELHDRAGAVGRLSLDQNPQPAIQNRYRRRYFTSFDQRLRVTVDTDLEFFDQRYHRQPNLTRRANFPAAMVVEFKYDRSDRDTVAQYLQTFPVRISRSSKYVEGLKSVHRL